MSGRWALDTNAYIDAAFGTGTVLKILDEAEDVFLPAPAVGEILYGALNSSRRSDNIATADEFIAACIVLPVDESAARCCADLRFGLKEKGRPLPENDIWIAAVCLEHDLPLLSRDTHFHAIPGLTVHAWELPPAQA